MKLAVIVLVSAALFLSGCSSSKTRSENEASHRMAETQVQLGVGYMQKGDLDIALEKLQRALVTADDYVPAHSSIAILYARLGRYADADKHYKRAVALAPDNGVGYNNYGAFLCDQQRYDEAYVHFNKAAEQRLYKTPALAYENAGLCAMREQNIEAAEAAFRRALKINGKLTVSLINMANVSLQKQRYLQGRAYIQRFEEVASHSAETLWLAIEIEQGLGDGARVANLSDMLRSRFPGSVQAGQLTE